MELVVNGGADRGFSLLEILAAIAIMAGTLLVFFDLIDHSLRVFGESDAAARNELTIGAKIAIRRDVQEAAQLPVVGTVSAGVLELELQDGTRVSWRRQDGALVRLEEGGHRAPVESRPLSRSVTGWRWEVVAPTLLEVRIDLASAPPITGLRQTGLADATPVFSSLEIHVSPRGSRGEGSW